MHVYNNFFSILHTIHKLVGLRQLRTTTRGKLSMPTQLQISSEVIACQSLGQLASGPRIIAVNLGG